MARGRHYAKLSLSNAARLSFSDLCILLFLFLFLCRLCVCVFLCSHWSLVDVPLIFFCPADHVPDWQPRALLGMVEARSVNVKKTTTTTTTGKNTCAASFARRFVPYRGNYNYDLSLRPRKTQRVNSTTPRSRRFLKSFPIFSNRRHVFRRLCPIRGPFIALRQCRRRVNSTTPRSRFLSASTQFATVPEAFSRFLQRLPNLQQCRR